ncbi:MAG TPA: hypothetical protein DHV36_15790 [Desulfobacteraceae bacterium]|mgnify:CR=1 FL=1|nr:hypothetical protein [Desulfobacteraceae bacterium]
MFFYRTSGDIRVNIDNYWTQATLSDADAYFEARGSSDWGGEDAVKTQAMQRAWDYLKTLSWVDDVFTVEQPEDITNAHILLSLEELKAPGVLTPALTRDDYISSKNTGGAIQKSYRSNAPAWKRFRGVEMLLGPYVRSRANIRVERG